MQIELIGCTSSGKSSLARNLLKSDAQQGFNLVTSYDFVLQWAHLDWIKNHRVRMLLLNVIAFLACLFTWRKNLAFYRFAGGVIARLPHGISLFEKLKIARIAARNVGIFEIVHRNKSDRQVVLADEGTLHIAHYLFVHVSVEPDLSHLDTFIHMVSLPDVAVYIRQPESVLISRASRRGHKRIPEGASVMVNRFIQHGRAVFEELAECSNLADRLVIVNDGEVIQPARESQDNPRLEFARKLLAFNSIP